MTDDPDVLVVGGGPAGSTVAGLLTRRGHRVLLVDRDTFPRPKPCGECLNPGAVAALDRLGLRAVVEALEPAELRGWSVGGAWTRAEADFGPGVHGLGVPRSLLDAALLEEARRRGAQVVQGVRVEGVDPAADGRRPRVRARDGAGLHTLRPAVVVGADGLRSRVARCLGLVDSGPGGGGKLSLTVRVRWGADAPPLSRRDRGRLRVRDGVTLGLAPVARSGAVGNLSVVVSAARFGDEVSADARGFVARRMEAVFGGEGLEIVEGPWASGPFRRPVTRPWAPGVVLVGDAAGYFDPFTGQGIHRALRSAELAADAVHAALTSTDGSDDGASQRPLRAYARRWRDEVAPGRRIQRVVDAVMARPWLREPTLAALGPRTLAPIIRVTGDILPVSSLILPSRRIPPESPCEP